jgi:hypothetical protein
VSPTPRRRRATTPPDPFPERGLAELGLAPGDQVRFRRSDAERWKPATVARRERDGSVGLHDPKGASRAIPVACIEVRGTGPRGGVVWEPLPERAARTEQMALVGTPAEPERRGVRPLTEPPPVDAGTDPPEADAETDDGDRDDGDGSPGDDRQLRLL